MDWLNYHHLRYFWTVAREGSIVSASKILHLTPQTISGQIHELQDALGEQLFTRSGRNLVLTDVGQMVMRYADEIFSLGGELTDALKGRPIGRELRFVVGVADVIPKLTAHRLLQPALQMSEPVRIVCLEGKTDMLLAELALHKLDMVLSDAPMDPRISVRAFNHLLGECGITFFGVPRLASKYRDGFPKSLDGAPFLLPTESTTLRRSLENWFDSLRISPKIRGEFEDSALLKAFGQAGVGIFAAPTIVEDNVIKQYRVKPVGHTNEVNERFYAISVERRLKHPAIITVSEAAHEKLFG